MASEDQADSKEQLIEELKRRFSPTTQIDVLMIAHYVQLSAGAPNAQERPVLAGLWQTYRTRLEKYLETPRANRTLAQLAELEELRSWVMPPKRHEWTSDHDDVAGDVLVKSGNTYAKAKENIKKIRQLGRGRPRSTSEMAIRALETKIASPTLVWREVCDRVCDCGSQHDDSCLGRLKTAIGELNSILQKYGLPNSR
jgi:predicted negative regulator of RcsB-dependent stress response